MFQIVPESILQTVVQNQQPLLRELAIKSKDLYSWLDAHSEYTPFIQYTRVKSTLFTSGTFNTTPNNSDTLSLIRHH